MASTKRCIAMMAVVVWILPVCTLHHGHIQLCAPKTEVLRPLRGGGKVDAARGDQLYNGLKAGDGLMAEGRLPPKVVDWTCNDVQHWLKVIGLSEMCPLFSHHNVNGDVLLDLNEDRIARMGVENMRRLLNTVKAVSHVQKNERMPERKKIHVPGMIRSVYNLFTFRFLMTSEGKGGEALLEELVTANANLALVCALLLGVTMSWSFGATETCFCDKLTGKSCFCTTGFDLDGAPLFAFYAASTVASALFAMCVITAVIQILAAQECSDAHEILVFFDKLGEDEVLCGPLMMGGIFFTAISIGIYMTFNKKLGIIPNLNNPWITGSTALSVMVLIHILPKWVSLTRKLYSAKLYAAFHPEKSGYTSGVAS